MVTIPLKYSRPILNYAFLHEKSNPKKLRETLIVGANFGRAKVELV